MKFVTKAHNMVIDYQHNFHKDWFIDVCTDICTDLFENFVGSQLLSYERKFEIS